MAIVIQEISPIKLSGRSSLLVSFPYNPAIVDRIKSFQPAVWHKSLAKWEISSVYLQELLDELVYFDSIELIMKPNEIREISGSALTEDEIKEFKFEPFKHQIEAINYGLSKPKWLLLDGCGLGKTLEIIGLAETLHKRGLIDHCLIICGVNSVKLNWEREISKFSKESCRVIGKKITRTGSIRYETLSKRAEELKNPIDAFFVITNIETLRSDSVIEAISKSKNKFGMIAVDEVHKCGGKTSQQGGNLLKLKSDYKVAATGTLITNNALSAYLPLSWTENDQATLTNYKATYCNFGGFGGNQIIGYKNLDLLRDELESCSLRRTLSQVRADIPKLQIDFELVEQDEKDAEFYESIKQGIQDEALKIELNASNLLALTTRLRQATADPGILTSENIESSKLLRCRDLVEEIVSQGEKVVVFSTFKPPVYKLATMLAEYNPTVNTGDVRDDIIARNVADFQDNPDSKVFLATGAKMGIGHTLNASMYLIFLDIPWTWSDFDQQYSRVYRVTNTRPALIKVLGCARTIDERVWEIINTKKDVSDYLVDGQPSQSMISDMKSIIFNL